MRITETANKLSGIGKLRRVTRDRSIREAVFVFALTRVMIFVIVVVVGQTVVNLEGKQFYQDVLDPSTSFQRAPIGRRLRQAIARGDASWYCAVSEEGYERQPFDASVQRKWAFFPLYPIVLRIARTVTGECVGTGVFLSNVFFFLALIFLHKLTLEWGFDSGTANRAIFYLAVYPTSYFFSLPFTESLFLLLTVCSFLAARRERWLLVGILGALASATRSGGVLLFPALALYSFLRYRTWRPKEMLPLLLMPMGLIAFMILLWNYTGNPLAFKDVQVAWGRQPRFFIFTLWEYLYNVRDVAFPWNPIALNFAAVLGALGGGLYLLKRREWVLSLYTFTMLLLPLSTSSLQSVTRYVSVIFPIFIALGILGSRPRVDHTIKVIFIVLFGLLTALWAAHVSWALT